MMGRRGFDVVPARDRCTCGRKHPTKYFSYVEARASLPVKKKTYSRIQSMCMGFV